MIRSHLLLRRHIGLFLLFFLALTARMNSRALAEIRPNVILFIADDVSWNDYGCYGNKAARTPNIDHLASNGLKFTNAYLTASSCSPSRASIITGRYPHNTGKAAELHLPIAAHLPWFPELLREEGYYTALVGKNHMRKAAGGPQNDSGKKAFDLIDNGQLKDNHGAEGKWVSTLKNRPRDKPFFFWFAAIDAHRGWDADREWKDSYGAKHSPETVIVPPYLVDDQATRRDLASYYNEVTRFDFYIGEVVKELKEEGELENTLILVMADNGRPFPRAKTRLHDSGMKTALIAHWPKGIRQAGHSPSGLVSAIDIAPTIMRVAKVDPPPEFQGVSLTKVFADSAARVRRFAFSEHNWHDYEAFGRSVRDDQGHLFILNERPNLPSQGPADSVRSPSHKSLLKKKEEGALTTPQKDVFVAPRPRVSLFDTQQDSAQLKNLADDPAYKNKTEMLKKVLNQWMSETRDSIPAQLSRDSFDRQSGRSLGVKEYRFMTPGEDKKASRTNNPGPR